MNFPTPYNNGRSITPASTPIIGEQQVQVMRFDIHMTDELRNGLSAYAEATGLDGLSFMNYVLNRGLAAIRQDLLYAKEERDALRQDPGPAKE